MNIPAAQLPLVRIFTHNPAKIFSEWDPHKAVSDENVFAKEPSVPNRIKILAGIIAQFLDCASECRKTQNCESVQVMRSEGLRGFVTSQDLNNRPGQFQCGRGLRYESIRANQTGSCRRFMHAEKYDPGRGGKSTDLLSRIKATHNGHRQVKNHNVGR